MSSGQAGEFCCSLLLLFTQMKFSCFPLGHVSGWHGLFFFYPSLEILGLSCLAGLEKKWVLALSLLTLKRGPLFPRLFFFSSCIIAWDGEFEPLCTGGDEAMIFRSSPGIEASWRKESLNPGLWSHNLSPGALVQTDPGLLCK